MMKNECFLRKERFHLFTRLLYKNGKAQIMSLVAGRLVYLQFTGKCCRLKFFSGSSLSVLILKENFINFQFSFFLSIIPSVITLFLFPFFTECFCKNVNLQNSSLERCSAIAILIFLPMCQANLVYHEFFAKIFNFSYYFLLRSSNSWIAHQGLGNCTCQKIH